MLSQNDDDDDEMPHLIRIYLHEWLVFVSRDDHKTITITTTQAAYGQQAGKVEERRRLNVGAYLCRSTVSLKKTQTERNAPGPKLRSKLHHVPDTVTIAWA